MVTPNNTNPIATKPIGLSFSLKKSNAKSTVNTISAFDKSDVSEAVVWFNPTKYKYGAIAAPQIATIINNP